MDTLKPPTCPHCGYTAKDDRWKDGSAWEYKRPIGEAPCLNCGEWIKMIRVGDELRVFASWPALEAAWKAAPAPKDLT